MNDNELKRMWINQPSAQQPMHRLHGTNVLAHREYDGLWRIYFLSGSIISQLAPDSCLACGWRPQ